MGKVNSPLRLKECLQVPCQMIVIKKLFNPLRTFPGVTATPTPESQHQALPHSGCVWTVLKPECVSLCPDRGRGRPKKGPLHHSLDQLSLITSGRSRFAAVTAGDGGTLMSCHSLGRKVVSNSTTFGRPNLNRLR